MSSSNFVDYIKIFVKSGNGGAGSTHLHRDILTAKGGPDGGDGGRGGHIIVRGNSQYWTLIHLKYARHIFAEHGGSGGGCLMTGAEGDDAIIEVPLGTVARNAETGEFAFEITEDGEKKILVKGGRGGLGNNNFKSSTNQTPRFSFRVLLVFLFVFLFHDFLYFSLFRYVFLSDLLDGIYSAQG